MTEPPGTTRQLPRGRHGLPREQVIASQRERILRAMADAMAEKGYVGTSVAAVLKRAGVSRETFYEQFRSKEDCFEAAFERAVHGVIARLTAAADTDAPRPDSPEDGDRLDRTLVAYLEALAAEPAYSRLFLVEVYAAGADAVARRAVLQESFVAMIARLLDARTEAQRFACQTLAAGISAMVTAKIAADDTDGLRGLRGPLLELIRRSGDLYGNAMA